MSTETELLLVGQAARILKRPDHQVRRTADRLWPNAPRSGRFRMIARADLCQLAAAIADRYPRRNNPNNENTRPDSR